MHSDVLQAELAAKLALIFPYKRDGPKKNFLQEGSWQLRRTRHAYRRSLRYIHDAIRLISLDAIFNAWKQGDRCSQLLLRYLLRRRRMVAAQTGLFLRGIAGKNPGYYTQRQMRAAQR